MRVLLLTDSLSDLDGVGRYTLCLGKAMQELRPGLEIDVLLARKHRPTSLDLPRDWRVDVALPPDYFYYMSPPRWWASLALAVRRVRRAARAVDLVHAIKDYPHNLAGWLGARLAGKPCVATAHGTYSVQPLRARRHRRIARALYPRFAHMISVSRYTRARILAELPPGAIPPERITVVPNCVDARRLLVPTALGPRPWHAHPFTLGIGEVKERKGHHLALAAFARVAAERSDLHHYLVGRSEPGDEYRRALEAAARAAGVGERVHFLGNVSEEEKTDLLQRALVFVHTPVTAADGGFEGFGIVYLEAGAAGTPVVGTRDCGAEDAIVDGETGFLCTQNAAAVERALRALLCGPDAAALRARMGAAGREHAQRADWATNAARVLAIYDEVLGR